MTPAITFTNEQLATAYASSDDFNVIYEALCAAVGGRPSKLAVKNKLLSMLMDNTLAFKPIQNIDSPRTETAEKKDYAEYSLRGIFIPSHMLDNTNFSKAEYTNKKKSKSGTKFDVDVTNERIILTPIAT